MIVVTRKVTLMVAVVLGIGWLYLLYVLVIVPSNDKQGILDSPALMAEFPYSEMTCDKGITASYPTSEDGYTLLLGIRSQKFTGLVADHLRRGYGVIAVTTETPTLKGSYDEIFDALSSNKKFMLLNSIGRCSQDILGDVFKKFNIERVNIVYDSSDFVPYTPVIETSSAITCLINVLETVAKNKNVHVSVHHSAQKVPPYIPYRQNSQGEPDPYFTVATPSPIKECTATFNYNQYYDVFLKSVEIYTTTYKRLYNLDVTRVVS